MELTKTNNGQWKPGQSSKLQGLPACACSPSRLIGSETGRKLDPLLNHLLADFFEFSTPCAATISPRWLAEYLENGPVPRRRDQDLELSRLKAITKISPDRHVVVFRNGEADAGNFIVTRLG